MEKLCKSCGVSKPSDAEHWYFTKGKPTSGPCKECRKSAARAQYYADPATANARARKYREANPEKMQKLSKRWRTENAEKVAALQRANYLANREQRIAYERERRASGVASAQERARHAADPDRYRRKIRKKYKGQPSTPESREKSAAVLRAARAADPERFAAYDAKRYAKHRPHRIMSASVNSAMRSMLKANGTSKRTLRRLSVGWTVADLVEHLERLFEDGMSMENYGDWELDHIVPKSAFAVTGEDDEIFRLLWSLDNLAPLWAWDNNSKNDRLDWVLPDRYCNAKLRQMYERVTLLRMFG